MCFLFLNHYKITQNVLRIYMDRYNCRTMNSFKVFVRNSLFFLSFALSEKIVGIDNLIHCWIHFSKLRNKNLKALLFLTIGCMVNLLKGMMDLFSCMQLFSSFEIVLMDA